MEFKIDRSGCILLLLSGLVFHNFLTIESIKIGAVTLTYLRIVLLVVIPVLIFMCFKIYIWDKVAVCFFVFMIYFFARLGSNYKAGLALYSVLLAFFFLYTSIDNRKLIRKCINYVAAFAIFFSVIGVFEIVTGFHFGRSYLENLNSSSYTSAVGMYYNPNDFSAFLTVGIFYILLSDFNRVIKYVFSGISFIIIYINQSQICLLGILSFVLIAFVLKSKTQRMIRFIISLFLVLAMLVPVYKMIRNSSIFYRIYMYKYGIKNCLSHFWIGTGVGNYTSGMIKVGYVPQLHTSSDPHNVYLELAGQFGMVWVVLVIFLLIKLFHWYLKTQNCLHSLLCFGLVYIISFIGLASSSCLEKNYIYLALLVPLLYYRLNSDYKRRLFFWT